MKNITIRDLLECGVHFGHQTRRWNPRMKPYIFGERNGIYILDLQKTVRLAKKAVQFIYDIASAGGKVLFIGTKRQAVDVVAEEATGCGCYYVNTRWLGGLLTNFVTIQNSISRLVELEQRLSDPRRTKGLSKKELGRLEKERARLEKVFVGIKEMKRLPNVVFIVDVIKERIAVLEARKLGIPIVALVDTNGDPEGIDYIVPGNDDAIRSIQYFASAVAESVIEGNAVHQQKVAEEEAARSEERARQEAQRRAEAEKRKARERAVAKAAAERAAGAKADGEPEPTASVSAAEPPGRLPGGGDSQKRRTPSRARPKQRKPEGRDSRKETKPAAPADQKGEAKAAAADQKGEAKAAAVAQPDKPAGEMEKKPEASAKDENKGSAEQPAAGAEAAPTEGTEG